MPPGTDDGDIETAHNRQNRRKGSWRPRGDDLDVFLVEIIVLPRTCELGLFLAHYGPLPRIQKKRRPRVEGGVLEGGEPDFWDRFRVSGRGGFAVLAAGDGAHHERAGDAQGIGGGLGDDVEAETRVGSGEIHDGGKIVCCSSEIRNT